MRAWNNHGVIFRLGIGNPDYWRADPDLVRRFQSINGLIGPRC